MHRTGAILVAPLSAEWAESARAFLKERAYAVAWLHSVSLISFLMVSGGVAALLVDADLFDHGAAARIGDLRRIHGHFTVIVVGSSAGPDSKPALEGGSSSFVSWPFTSWITSSPIYEAPPLETTSRQPFRVDEESASGRDRVMNIHRACRSLRGPVTGEADLGR